jgi:transcriptional regulator with XRE-family HTH domain
MEHRGNRRAAGRSIEDTPMISHKVRAAVVGFGRRLRGHRLAANTTHAELAGRSRVSIKCISAIECGRTNPSLITMALLADGLGRGLAELFQAEDASRHTLTADDLRRAQGGHRYASDRAQDATSSETSAQRLERFS